MLRFRSFITEGGNIGDSAPFHVNAKNRESRQKDIHSALSAVHDAFHKEHGEHLFGKDKEQLHNKKAYTGSSHDLMNNKISHSEFAKHKPMVGDVDVQVSKEHKDKLASHLTPGKRYGKYTVAASKKHGNEISAVMKHDNGEHHQVDFQGVHNPGSESSRFLHSSNWEDTKSGIKGAHHKILLNAVGGDKHKFSITHGLRSRTDDKDPGHQHPDHVSKKLFGDKADHSKIHSFKGVTHLIKNHTPKDQHQGIYNKFKSSVERDKRFDNKAALSHMRKHLGVHDEVNEELNEAQNTQHAHLSFLGAAPHTHMGHHGDVGESMHSGPEGKKFIGLSGKADTFSEKEREGIANKQSGGKIEFKSEKSPGQTIARAHNSMKGDGPKHLHLHFGHDRKDYAERLKSSIEAGKIPELNGHKPDKVHIHYPKDTNRSHGMSGTAMRQAAHDGDIETYKKHLGPNFSHAEAKRVMDRTRTGILAGKMKLKR